MDLILLVGCEKRSIERVMDFPHFREVELICDRREDLDDCEGSFSFGGKLWVGDGSFEISGLKPDFVSFGKGGESLVVMRGHDLAGEFVCGEGFISGSDKGFKAGFYRGNRRIGD